jgi:hypothetical protein
MYGGEIFKLREHTERLFKSAEILDFEIPFTVDEIDQACKETCTRNGLEDAYVRPIAWRGSEMIGVSAQNTRIHVAVAVWDWPSYFSPEQKAQGIRMCWAKYLLRGEGGRGEGRGGQEEPLEAQLEAGQAASCGGCKKVKLIDKYKISFNNQLIPIILFNEPNRLIRFIRRRWSSDLVTAIRYIQVESLASSRNCSRERNTSTKTSWARSSASSRFKTNR